MKKDDVERIEIDDLLAAMYQRYGYDFRSYARASVDRRVRQFLAGTGCSTISEMIPKLLNDKEFFTRLAQYFSISVTEMFRDPFVYRAIREKVVPVLRTYPFFKVWLAGCATGEEAYSLAILLKEEGLLKKATIYATDFNDEALDRVREAIYPLDRMREYTTNYQRAGGKTSLSEFYHAKYGSAVMRTDLKDHITIANHNLAVDSAFGEVHLVLCRNVLIYFNRDLQDRVLGLFTESLVHGGFLCLGTSEDIRFSAASGDYEVIDRQAKLYKRKIGI